MSETRLKSLFQRGLPHLRAVLVLLGTALLIQSCGSAASNNNLAPSAASGQSASSSASSASSASTGTPPALMTFADKLTGQTFSEDALDGYVAVFVSPGTSAEAVQALAASGQGSVLADFSEAGYYVISVPPGTERQFIAAADQEAFVEFAQPITDDEGEASGGFQAGNCPVPPPLTEVGPINAAVLDLFCGKMDICGASHGIAVYNIFSANAPSAPAVALNCANSSGGGPVALIMGNFVSAIQGAQQQTGRLVMNLSMGASETDAQGNPLPVATYLKENYLDWRAYAQVLQNLSQASPTAFANTLAFFAAGNGALVNGANNPTVGVALNQPITGFPNGILAALQGEFPVVFPPNNGGDHMIFVGSLNADGSLSSYAEYSTNPSDMIYALGNDVTISINGSACTGQTGTSYASPLAAGVLAQAWSAQITASPGNPQSGTNMARALFAAAAAVNAVNYSLPTVQAIVNQAASL